MGFGSWSFRTSMVIALVSLSIFSSRAHADEGTVVVMAIDHAAWNQLSSELRRTFEDQGTAAVVDQIEAMSRSPQGLAALKALKGGPDREIEVQIHPNESDAVVYLNQRLVAMGLDNLTVAAIHNEELSDPTSNSDEIPPGLRRLRLTAGPGAAVLAAAYQMATTTPGTQAHDYLYLLLPAIGGGIATIALEMNFAWPTLNTKFWQPAWRAWGLGGRFNPLLGRLVNIVVNTLYDLIGKYSAYAVGLAPLMFGGHPSANLVELIFGAVLLKAFVGGLVFHTAMGQYQTDLAIEVRRGSIDASQMYALETAGVAWNNGARVGGWVIPGSWSQHAMWGFFFLRTLGQALETNFWPKVQNAIIAARVDPAKKPNLWTRCMMAVSGLKLIPFAAMRKK